MSVLKALLKMDKKDFAMPKKYVEMPRLSKLAKEKIVFELQGIKQERMDEINEMVTNINMKTKDYNLDLNELRLSVISEGVIEPSFRNEELQDHFGVKTSYDLIKTMLTAGERDYIFNEIQQLSGYGENVVKEVKKQ
mgnify:CR=1 FL=1